MLLPTTQTIGEGIYQLEEQIGETLQATNSDDNAKQKKSYANRLAYKQDFLVILQDILEDMDSNGNPPPIPPAEYIFGEQPPINGFS